MDSADAPCLRLGGCEASYRVLRGYSPQALPTFPQIGHQNAWRGLDPLSTRIGCEQCGYNFIVAGAHHSSLLAAHTLSRLDSQL